MNHESVSDPYGYICIVGTCVCICMDIYTHMYTHICVQTHTHTCKLEKIMARHHEGESITGE